jgi:hypothetical protein
MCAQECTLHAEEFLVSSCFLLQMTEGEVLKKTRVIATPETLLRIKTNANLEM